jgi:hypothetical protein
MLLLVLLSMGAAAASPAKVSTAKTEMLSIDVPDEFEIGHQARNDTIQIMELVEPPETVENWSKLVTSLMFLNAAQRGTGPFYKQWRDNMARSCSGISDNVQNGTVDGMPALRAKLSCPKNPQTGKPENLEAILVQGQANIMMVQVALRRSMTPTDKALIERVAGSMKVCDQRTLSTCSARKATGFLPRRNGL